MFGVIAGSSALSCCSPVVRVDVVGDVVAVVGEIDPVARPCARVWRCHRGRCRKSVVVEPDGMADFVPNHMHIASFCCSQNRPIGCDRVRIDRHPPLIAARVPLRRPAWVNARRAPVRDASTQRAPIGCIWDFTLIAWLRIRSPAMGSWHDDASGGRQLRHATNPRAAGPLSVQSARSID